MHQHQPRVNQVVGPARWDAVVDVVAEHPEVRTSGQLMGLRVDGDHGPAGSDAVGEPARDGPATRADLEAACARTGAECVQEPPRRLVEQHLQVVDLVASQVGRGVEDVLGAHTFSAGFWPTL